MIHQANITTAHRIPLYFTGETAEQAICGLAWEDADQAHASLRDDPYLTENHKVFSFWAYIDPDSAEEVAP